MKAAFRDHSVTFSSFPPLEGRGNRVHGRAISFSWDSQLVALQHEKRTWNASIFAHILQQARKTPP